MTEIFKRCGFKCSTPVAEAESEDYDASTFKLDSHQIKFRSGKVTPTKVGLFVTLWKRNAQGVTAPHDETDPFDFYIVHTKKEKLEGYFIFPQSALAQYGVLSKKHSGGKRGFRVYPSWDIDLNKQAKQTQSWQLKYFVSISDADLIAKIKKLVS